MGNLSQSKKHKLRRGNRQAKVQKMDKQIEAENEFAIRQHRLMERPVAAYIRWICQESPTLMLGWSYPKEPRPHHPYIILKNHAGDNMYVYGNPYRAKPDGIAGVKMAAEIDLPCDVDIPTEDFSVPDMAVFEKGITAAMEILINKGEIYIGCMGGIGRTGLAIAGLIKLHDQLFQASTRKATVYRDHIRHHVHPHAIETKQQLDFIDQYVPKGI